VSYPLRWSIMSLGCKAKGEGKGMRVVLASPRGFCAGVDRAIEVVERALALYGPPVYVLHEIVHNRHVLEDFRGRGVRFVESLEEIPPGSVTVFSAHGVSQEVEERGRVRNLRVIDATCPLVTKVHLQAQRYEREEREIVLVGHPGHPEVEGTRGRIAGKVHVLSTVEEVERLEVSDPAQLAYVTQTTLSVDDTRAVIEALERRFPLIRGPELADICYATQNRQNAVKALADRIDVLLVVGSPNSSNSNRLRELGTRRGIASQLIDSERDLDPGWFRPGTRIGLTAGASAPETLVQRVLERLLELGVSEVVEMEGEPESVVFQLPSELRAGESARA
jgi:4-hydroxy-3-methylbut-2-enyl diphosphate reductase